MTQIVVLTIFPLLLIYAAIGDVRAMRIPNWLNGLMAAAFFPVAFLAGMPLAEMGWHLAAFGVVLLAGMALFTFGFIGGGDAKMLAAAALWVGWGDALMMFVIITAVGGGLLAIVMKLWQLASLEQGVWGRDGALRKALSRNLELPYGVAIAAGALLAYPSAASWWSAVISG